MSLGPGGYVTGLTFDGVSLQRSNLSIVLWISRGLNDVPMVRGTDDIVPASAGRVVRNRVADVLPIELKGYVLAPAGIDSLHTASQFREHIEILRALFDGTLTPRVLSALLEDSTTATINARVVPPIVITEVVPSHVAEVDVQLESVSPDWTFVGGS